MHMFYRIKKRIAGLLPHVFVETYLRWRWPFYWGFRYECPFCNTTFRRMVPGGCLEPVCERLQITGMGYQTNMTCPRCGAINRWRLLWLYLQRTEVMTKRLCLLHISPEANIQTALKRLSHIDYLSVDLENPIAMKRMDLTNLDIADNSMDVVICSHVLEHIPNDRQAISEIFRVLKPGGWAILQVPISRLLDATFEDPDVSTPSERLQRYGQADHVRIYGKDYVRRLEAAGFRVSHPTAIEYFGEGIVRRFALDPAEEIYRCEKPLC